MTVTVQVTNDDGEVIATGVFTLGEHNPDETIDEFWERVRVWADAHRT